MPELLTDQSKNKNRVQPKWANLIKDKYNTSNDPSNPFSESGKGDLAEKTQAYLEKLERQLSGLRKDGVSQTEADIQQRKDRMYGYLLKKLTVNVFPEKSYQNQLQAAEDQGYGRQNYEQNIGRDKFFEIKKQEQTKELKSWFDYILSEDAMYPLEFKYLVLRDIAGSDVGGGKRSKDTGETYPAFDAGAISKVYEDWVQSAKDNKGKVPKINFVKPYTEKLGIGEKAYKQMMKEIEVMGAENTTGKWVKYEQNSDPAKLAIAVGRTPWCTAGTTTAEGQLKEGPFYVYFTNNTAGEPVFPRIAIRTENDGKKIGEIKGVADTKQNLEGQFAPIVKEKLQEEQMEGYEEYTKKAEDTTKLTDIKKRHNGGQELTKEDLRFLYEIDGQIQNFGYGKDPRVNELVEGRDVKVDLAIVFDCTPEQVVTDEKEVDSQTIVYFGQLSSLELDLEIQNNHVVLENLRYIIGNADFENSAIQSLPVLQSIDGYASFKNSAIQSLPILQNISGEADFENSAIQSLPVLRNIGRDAHFENTSIQSLQVLQNIDGNAYFYNSQIQSLPVLQSIGGNADFDNTQIQSLSVLQSIGGDAYFRDSQIQTQGFNTGLKVENKVVLSTNQIELAKFFEGKCEQVVNYE